MGMTGPSSQIVGRILWQCQMPHRPVPRHLDIQMGGGTFLSGSLQEGSGQWSLPPLGDTAKPATRTQPAPEGLPKCGPRPHTAHCPAPQDMTQRPTEPAHDTGPQDGHTTPQGQLWGCMPCLVPPPPGLSLPQSSLDSASSSVCGRRQPPAGAPCPALQHSQEQRGKLLDESASPAGTRGFPVPSQGLLLQPFPPPSLRR